MNDKIAEKDKNFIKFIITLCCIMTLPIIAIAINNNAVLHSGIQVFLVEHEYSDRRENETALYQDIGLEDSAMVIIFRNLSLTRNYLLFQFEEDNKHGFAFWFEFNETESETLWLNHNNKDFYLCTFIEPEMCITGGWVWIIKFGVKMKNIKYQGEIGMGVALFGTFLWMLFQSNSETILIDMFFVISITIGIVLLVLWDGE